MSIFRGRHFQQKPVVGRERVGDFSGPEVRGSESTACDVTVALWAVTTSMQIDQRELIVSFMNVFV